MKNPFLVPAITILIGITIYVGSVFYDHFPIAPGPLAPTHPPMLAEMQYVPDFAVTTLDGARVRLSQFRGRVVIVNFWATWCAPCVKEFPDLLDLVETYKGAVVLLALSSDINPHVVKTFIKNQVRQRETPLNPDWVRVALDTGRRITRDQFQVTAYPESLIIDRTGHLARHVIGSDDWGKTETQDLVRSLVHNAQ